MLQAERNRRKERKEKMLLFVPGHRLGSNRVFPKDASYSWAPKVCDAGKQQMFRQVSGHQIYALKFGYK
jgi:hypothetical protein